MSDATELHGPFEEATGDSTGAGALPVLVATAIVGIAGYVITWLVPRIVGVAEYSIFAIFWAFTFLVAAGLSGIQQEVSRATRPRTSPSDADHGRAHAGRFAVTTAVIVFVVILGTAPLWVDVVFPSDGWTLVWPLATGAASYTLLAVLTGSLYGTTAWRPLFWVILIEGVLRLALIAAVLTLTHDHVWLAWAVAAPFAATVAIMWPATRRRLTGRTVLDVGYRQLVWNVARTIVAATAMGALVSGFPLLLSLAVPRADPQQFGLLVLAATLVRAPLIVVGMALQSYLVVLFRNRQDSFWKILMLLEGLVLVVGALLALLGWWLGPAVFGFLYPGEPEPSGALIATLVGSSALVGALCITAPAVLSRSRHIAFTAGWVVAAVVTIGCLLIPLPLEARTILALVAGPATGLAVHLGALLAARREREPEEAVA
ncbi:hypothetical protein ESP57_04290 [Agromyces fucosus]|uniref:Polysaccharide biosynthesis protein n=1 Tax=Agromyces fucosus TaxID=41985 RepID=A0A4Q2JS77_9MICO|nr:hypothetical protein [Agromyces fucosus]RXZ51012.1 hypothetical protein ESP57_04290 [Agromyces fucosus]